VNRIDQRIMEAEKLGFKKMFISRYNRKGLDLEKYRIELVGVGKVEQFLTALFS